VSGRYVSENRPFPGLRAFEFEDQAFFFGREDQVSALYRLLDRNRFTAVVGSSGSGKSSLVKAGLLPLIQQESDDPGGRSWCWLTLHPGDAPMAALEQALSDLATVQVDESAEDRAIRRERIGFALRRSSFGLTNALEEIPNLAGTSILLVIDQFEEIFRFPGDEAVKFVQVLLEVGRDRSRAVNVLLTMRSDFIGDCSHFYDLPEAVSAAQFLVPSLTRDQRDAAIRKPVNEAKATIESTLVERLLNDVLGENDQLPVLQHCLARIWSRAKPPTPGAARHLALQDYDDVGKISGALSQHGDEMMNGLSPAMMLAVEQLFRSLSKVDEDGRVTRRSRLFSEVVAESGLPETDMREAVDVFRADDCSFVVPPTSVVPAIESATRIDIVHEALLRKWEKISANRNESLGGRTGWLNAEAEDGRFYRALLALLARKSGQTATLPAEQIENGDMWWTGRDKNGDLVRPPKTPAWADRYGGGYDRVDRLFKDTREKLAADRKILVQAKSAKRSGRIAVAAAAIALLALGVVGWSIRLTTIANSATMEAKNSADLATRSERVAILKTKLAKYSLNRATSLFAVVKRQLVVNKLLEAQLKIRMTAAQSSEVVAQTESRRANSAAGFARNEEGASYIEAGRLALVEDKNLNDAAIYLAAAYKLNPNDPDLHVLLPQAIRELALRPTVIASDSLDQQIVAFAFDSAPGSGEFVTASGSRAQIWDSAGYLLRTYENHDKNLLTAVGFDPSGRYVAAADEDGSVEVYDMRLSADAPSRELPHEQFTRVNALAFSPDSARIATASTDGAGHSTIVVSQLATGKEVSQIVVDRAAKASIDDLAFRRNGELVAAMSDGTLRFYDAQQRSTTVDVAQAPVLHIAVSKDGDRVAAGAADGTVAIYDRRAGTSKRLPPTGGAVSAIAFDAAGCRVLVAGQAGVGRILYGGNSTVRCHVDASVSTGETLGDLHATGTPSPMRSIASNAAGTTIATTYENGHVATWTMIGTQLTNFRAGLGAETQAAFSPQSGMLVTSGDDGKVRQWPLKSVLTPANASNAGGVESIAFDPDGRQLLTGGRDGTAILWRVGTDLRRESTLSLDRKGAWVVGAAFSNDGRRALVAGGDRVKIWSVTGGQAMPLGDPIVAVTSKPKNKNLPRRIVDAAFAPNGNVFAIQTDPRAVPEAPYDENQWRMWSLSPDAKQWQRVGGESSDMWWTAPRKGQLSSDGRYVALTTSDNNADVQYLATGNVVSGTNFYDTTIAVLGHRTPAYAIGSTFGTIGFTPRVGESPNWWSYPGQGRVSALTFSADDRWLAFAGDTNLQVSIVDVSPCERTPPFPGCKFGMPVHAYLRGHSGTIRTIAFSPGAGNLVLTVSADGSAKVWDRDTGALLGTAALPRSDVTVAAFSPEGDRVALGSADGSVYLWQLRPPFTADAVRSLASNADSCNPEENPLLARAIRQLGSAPNPAMCGK
jgi:WD40 repeat protein/energy-coupling factor transporter ATP-binding protein EcfA2